MNLTYKLYAAAGRVVHRLHLQNGSKNQSLSIKKNAYCQTNMEMHKTISALQEQLKCTFIIDIGKKGLHKHLKKS